MTLHEFVRWALTQRVSGQPRYLECLVTGASWSHGWHVDSDIVRVWFDITPFAAVIYPDGSAQLLSRDEEECLLFQTLWELEK
jgi:hypothetical protein